MWGNAYVNEIYLVLNIHIKTSSSICKGEDRGSEATRTHLLLHKFEVEQLKISYSLWWVTVETCWSSIVDRDSEKARVSQQWSREGEGTPPPSAWRHGRGQDNEERRRDPVSTANTEMDIVQKNSQNTAVWDLQSSIALQQFSAFSTIHWWL